MVRRGKKAVKRAGSAKKKVTQKKGRGGAKRRR
jgi:hypothetical protein